MSPELSPLPAPRPGWPETHSAHLGWSPSVVEGDSPSRGDLGTGMTLRVRRLRVRRAGPPSFRTGNFPGPRAGNSLLIRIKGVHPARGATEPAQPALPPAFPPQTQTLRAETHGPSRDRRSPAPPCRDATPAPGGRRPARSR